MSTVRRHNVQSDSRSSYHLRKFCQCIWMTCKTGETISRKAEKIGLSELKTEQKREVFRSFSEGNEMAINTIRLFDSLKSSDGLPGRYEEYKWLARTIKRTGLKPKGSKANYMILFQEFCEFFEPRPRTEQILRSRASNFSKGDSRRYAGSSVNKKEERPSRNVSRQRQVVREPDPPVRSTEREHQSVQSTMTIATLKRVREETVTQGDKRFENFLQSQAIVVTKDLLGSNTDMERRDMIKKKIEESIQAIQKQVASRQSSQKFINEEDQNLFDSVPTAKGRDIERDQLGYTKSKDTSVELEMHSRFLRGEMSEEEQFMLVEKSETQEDGDSIDNLISIQGIDCCPMDTSRDEREEDHKFEAPVIPMSIENRYPGSGIGGSFARHFELSSKLDAVKEDYTKDFNIDSHRSNQTLAYCVDHLPKLEEKSVGEIFAQKTAQDGVPSPQADYERDQCNSQYSSVIIKGNGTGAQNSARESIVDSEQQLSDAIECSPQPELTKRSVTDVVEVIEEYFPPSFDQLESAKTVGGAVIGMLQENYQWIAPVAASIAVDPSKMSRIIEIGSLEIPEVISPELLESQIEHWLFEISVAPPGFEPCEELEDIYEINQCEMSFNTDLPRLRPSTSSPRLSAEELMAAQIYGETNEEDIEGRLMAKDLHFLKSSSKFTLSNDKYSARLQAKEDFEHKVQEQQEEIQIAVPDLESNPTELSLAAEPEEVDRIVLKELPTSSKKRNCSNEQLRLNNSLRKSFDKALLSAKKEEDFNEVMLLRAEFGYEESNKENSQAKESTIYSDLRSYNQMAESFKKIKPITISPARKKTALVELDTNIRIDVNSKLIDRFNATVGRTRTEQFSLTERVYAQEKEIELSRGLNKFDFYESCVVRSARERVERAARVEESRSRALLDTELPGSPSPIKPKRGLESPSPVKLPLDSPQKGDQLGNNEYFRFFRNLVQIERECNAIRDELSSLEGYDLSSFTHYMFSKAKFTNSSYEPLLHKNKIFKTMRILNCKADEKKFDAFWGHKFHNVTITRKEFLLEFFFKKEYEVRKLDGEEFLELSEYPQNVKDGLAKLFDLCIAKEQFFQIEKIHVSVCHIMDFIKKVTKEKRDYLLLRDVDSLSQLAGYCRADIAPVFNRFLVSEYNQRLNAYNICVLLS